MRLRTRCSRACGWLVALAALAMTVSSQLIGDEKKPLEEYSAIVVQPFTLSRELNADGMPPGYENVLQKTLFARLLSERVFERVEESAEAPRQPGTVIVSGEVADYSKGSRAARLAIGYGAGSAKIKVVIVFRDAVTGAEVLRLERTGRYAGFGNLTGGSADKARSESARKVVDGLMKQIKAAR